MSSIQFMRATHRSSLLGAAKTPAVLSQAPGYDVEPVWFALLRFSWTSLVLIPAHPGGSALPLATELARIGSQHRGSPIKVIDAAASDLTTSGRLLMELIDDPLRLPPSPGEWGAGSRKGPLLRIIALESVLTSHAGIPIALAADARPLCVELGATDYRSAAKTIELIGRPHVRGCVLI